MSTLFFDVGENSQLRTWIVRNGPTPTSTPIDLTNATAVHILIDKPFPTSDKTCTFVASAAGSVSVTMLAADLTLAGTFDFKTKITFADGTVAYVPKPGYDRIEVGSPPT